MHTNRPTVWALTIKRDRPIEYVSMYRLVKFILIVYVIYLFIIILLYTVFFFFLGLFIGEECSEKGKSNGSGERYSKWE